MADSVKVAPYKTSLDGFRAIVHLSLIALHVSMLTTSHLPSKGDEWIAFKKNPVFTFFQAGGIQVDLMFMISGYLLIESLLFEVYGGRKSSGVLAFMRHRALRLLPPIIIISLLAYFFFGDTVSLE